MHTSYGHTYALHQRAGDRAARRGEAEHADLPRAAPRAWASTTPASPTTTRRWRAARFGRTRVDFDRVARAGLGHARPRPTRRSPTAASRRRRASAVLDVARACGVPDHRAQLRDRRVGARSWQRRYPLAMISPPARNFLNSSFVNVQQPARDRRRAAARDPRRATRRRAASPTAHVVRVFNDRGSYRCKAAVSERARARASSTAWASGGASSAPDGTQRQRADAPAPDRHRPRRRRSTTAWSRSSRRDRPLRERWRPTWRRSAVAATRCWPSPAVCADLGLRRRSATTRSSVRAPRPAAAAQAGGRVAGDDPGAAAALKRAAGAVAAHARLRGQRAGAARQRAATAATPT